jgi:DNA-binding response OmpR family regulator
MSFMNVLLIEDHKDIAANIAEYFEARGNQVAHAFDGEAGLDMAQRDDYDAIVLDLMLPGIDGLSVCRQLRATNSARVPILMLTAKDLVADKVEGFEAGADDYLVKPFSLAELDVRLKALIRRSRPAEVQRTLNVGDLKFDLDTLEAERAGVAIKLNPTTRRILVVLMQNANRVVTRAELEKELWGEQPPEGDFLRAHMHALRAAIDKNFPDKLLHTVHGIGYRIATDPARP